MGSAGRGEMTLVVTLSAVRRLADPSEAIADAGEWSERVGVVSDSSSERAEDVLDANDVEYDFLSATGKTAGSLAAIRQRFRTERHVLVGTSDAERQTAQALGWEYLPVEEAAEKADWNLTDDADADPEQVPHARLLRRIVLPSGDFTWDGLAKTCCRGYSIHMRRNAPWQGPTKTN